MKAEHRACAGSGWPGYQARMARRRANKDKRLQPPGPVHRANCSTKPVGDSVQQRHTTHTPDNGHQDHDNSGSLAVSQEDETLPEHNKGDQTGTKAKPGCVPTVVPNQLPSTAEIATLAVTVFLHTHAPSGYPSGDKSAMTVRLEVRAG